MPTVSQVRGYGERQLTGKKGGSVGQCPVETEEADIPANFNDLSEEGADTLRSLHLFALYDEDG